MKKLFMVLLVMSGAALLMAASGDFDKYVGKGDLAVTVAVADSTYVTQTFGIGSTKGFKTAKGKITLNPSPVSLRGYGLADSGFIRVYSNFAGARTLVAQDSSEGLPTTLEVRILEAVGDTLLGDYLEFDISVYDSTGDTAMTLTHPVHWNFLLK